MSKLNWSSVNLKECELTVSWKSSIVNCGNPRSTSLSLLFAAMSWNLQEEINLQRAVFKSWKKCTSISLQTPSLTSKNTCEHYNISNFPWRLTTYNNNSLINMFIYGLQTATKVIRSAYSKQHSYMVSTPKSLKYIAERDFKLISQRNYLISKS